jgi:uncharacterized protein YbjT (DUF2867 family)
VRNGVRHLLKITNHKAYPDSPVARRRDHARIEEHLRSTGLGHTLLGPNLFMQNLLATAQSIKDTSSFTMSTGDGKSGMVDARDVGAAAAAVAADPEPHDKRTYLLTGPELVSYTDVASTLSDTLGRAVHYRKLSPEQHEAAMIGAGVPESVADSNAQVFGLIAEGDAAWLSDDVEKLTGTKPRSLRTFLTDHAEAFR